MEATLSSFEDKLKTARDISLERMRCLGPTEQKEADDVESHIDGYNGGLPTILVSLLYEAFETWQSFYHTIEMQTNPCEEKKFESSSPSSAVNFSSSNEMKSLQRVIDFLVKISQLDSTLGEEIGRAGSQGVLFRLLEQIKHCIAIIESDDEYSEEDFDALMDLQDSACEIYSPQIRDMPCPDEELRSRLPLVYNLTAVTRQSSQDLLKDEAEKQNTNGDGDEITTILISQVTKRQSAQADVGFVMWPSAIVLSRWLISNPLIIQGKSILELGAGCGLVGIVAARLIAKHENGREFSDKEIDNKCSKSSQVIITDINDLVLDNIAQNIKLNEVNSIASVAKLDFYRQTGHSPGGWLASEMKGMNEQSCEPVDIILAADIICQPDDAVAAAKTIHDTLVPPTLGKPGGVALVVCADSEHRFGVEIFASECEKNGLEVKATKVSDMYDGKLLSECMESACGYVESMNLTFFKIIKR